MTLDKWCYDNWMKIDEAKRKACVDHLRGWIPDGVIDEWKRDGLPESLHMFGGGMQIRNRLRDIIKDDELPVVALGLDGQTYGQQNWDDYYMGALFQLMGKVPT